MEVPSAPPTIEVLSQATGGDVVKYEVSIGGDRRADLVVFRDRVNVFLESSEKPKAMLRLGGPASGALWLEGDLIAEFMKEPAGSFVVVEIEDGFKKPILKEDTDPIRYLLDRLASCTKLGGAGLQVAG